MAGACRWHDKQHCIELENADKARIRELENAIRKHRDSLTAMLNGGAMVADRTLWATIDKETS